MSLLIKGMEMPTTCRDCRLSTLTDFDSMPFCNITMDDICFNDWETKRLDNCPLALVPPHGRLIDADALENRVVPASRFFEIPNANVVVLGVIKAAPTIIPADEPFGKSEQLNV